MTKKINEEGVRCPFYSTMDSKSITCEGITDECWCILRFSTMEAKSQHRKIFCSRKYENCELYIMLEKKYEDE